MTPDQQQLFSRMVLCQKPSEMRDLLSELGDNEDVTLGASFGEGFKWVPFGDNQSNISTIGLATKPGKSLTERLTNAMDALLEERAESSSGSLPQSPAAAAELWFGRPLTGPESGLFSASSLGTERRFGVVLLNSGEEDAPTVDVIDQGIGLQPALMPKTILSLQAGNKITKRHQIGAFGQGGSSTLGFSEFVFIASRYRGNPTKVGFTVIKVAKLDASYKEDCYAYLVSSSGAPLEIELAAGEDIQLYPEMAKAPSLSKGTLVRHIGYRLNGLAKSLSPSPGNLYHYLHYNIFDPLLPFRIWDLRSSSGPRDEYVGGSRNRLMKLTESAAQSDASGRVQVKHYRPMEYIAPSGALTPCVGIEYWVVLAYRKKGDSNEEVLRGNSAELFVQANYPIVGTLNGQTQGELSSAVIKELGFTLLSRHMVVHIETSRIDSPLRRQLFSTSREGFKDGPVLDSIVSSLKRMLSEDEELEAVEKELTERLARRDTATTREEVRQQVTKLLRESGMEVSEKATSDTRGKGERTAIVAREKRPTYKRREPLPTLPFPEVTFLRFAAPDQHLPVALQDSELVLLETDADAEFDRRGLVAIRASGGHLEVESKAGLAGGRIRWRMRPTSTAKAGDVGELIATITKPDGVQVTASISYEVLPAKERPAKTGKTLVPPFEIKAIAPSDEEDWGQVWPEDKDEDAYSKHAYRSLKISGKTWVFYSTVFPPYTQALERLKASKPELVQAFTTSYEVWIAYHAILQSQAEEEYGAPEGKLEDLLDHERGVVASMQVKQAMQFAELWKRAAIQSGGQGSE